MSGYPFAVAVHPSRHQAMVVEVLEGITSEAAPRLADTLREITAHSSRIVLNLGRCDYICSTGIGVLHYWKTHAVKGGGDLKISAACEFVGQMIAAALGTSLRQYPSDAEALAAFAVVTDTAAAPPAAGADAHAGGSTASPAPSPGAPQQPSKPPQTPPGRPPAPAPPPPPSNPVD